MSDRLAACLILGAGFSHAAGYPLTRELFETNDLPHTPTGPRPEHRDALDAYQRWKITHSNQNAEEWLQYVFSEPDMPLITGTTWQDALSFALARLVQIPAGQNSHYYWGITTPVASETHRDFWRFMRARFDVRSIVTTNYDLLIEQGLKNDYTIGRSAPLCRYGGYPFYGPVKKMVDVTTGRFEPVELGTDIVLHKLHGSLNWAEEPHGFKIHDDVRAVFRTSVRSSTGKRATYDSAFESRGAAVVPPLPEKQMPEWLSRVWKEAERDLSRASVWLVCGYSMPDYDQAVRELFQRAARKTKVLQRIIIMSPDSADLVDRWKRICPQFTQIFILPGLPEAMSPAAWTDIPD